MHPPLTPAFPAGLIRRLHWNRSDGIHMLRAICSRDVSVNSRCTRLHSSSAAGDCLPRKVRLRAAASRERFCSSHRIRSQCAWRPRSAVDRGKADLRGAPVQSGHRQLGIGGVRKLGFLRYCSGGGYGAGLSGGYMEARCAGIGESIEPSCMCQVCSLKAYV